VDPASVVTATKAQASARILWASRLGSPIPDAIDTRGVGVVDFSHDRIWITDRLVTDRVAAERAEVAGPFGRLVNRSIYVFLNWLVGGGREVYYEGAARWKPKKGGGWRRSAISVSSPKHNRHPLCILDAIARAQFDTEPERLSEVIREVETTRYSLTLTPDLFDPEIWAQISKIETNRGQRSHQELMNRGTVQAFVWLDDRSRIRRMSYESIYDGSASGTLWSITEFWEFGIPIDREPPE
jgi:hypothetical protein